MGTGAALALALLGCGGGPSQTGSCPNDYPAVCPSPPPSFAADVSPIVASVCQLCHTSTGIASNRPFETWQQIHDVRTTVLSQLRACLMPPSYAPQLSEEQRLTFLSWLRCGSPDN